jgi:hypothetical protein
MVCQELRITDVYPLLYHIHNHCLTLGNPRYKFDICKSYCKRKCAFLLDFCWVVYEELQNKDVYLCTTLKIPVWLSETPKINVIKKSRCTTSCPVKSCDVGCFLSSVLGRVVNKMNFSSLMIPPLFGKQECRNLTGPKTLPTI